MTTGLTIPTEVPLRKFLRYVRALEKSKPPLFPLSPATRPLRVAIDIDTLGGDPATYRQLLEDLNREEVSVFLIAGPATDDSSVTAWETACKVQKHYKHHFAGIETAQRWHDSIEFWVETIEAGEHVGSRRCNFFDMYAALDAAASPVNDLTNEHRTRAAAFANASYNLGIDVIVSLSPTVGRADVGDNDIVSAVHPDDFRPVFGHYLRMTGNRVLAQHRTPHQTTTWHGGQLTEVYEAGVRALLPYTEMLEIVAIRLGKTAAVAELASVITRVRRAARALDEVFASLSRTNGYREHPDTDTIEFVSEAFDRELLYLIAALDTYGRAFYRWLNLAKDERPSLHSEKTLTKYVDPNYPNAPQLGELHALQKFAYTAAQLRNQLHSNVLHTGPAPSRPYGSAQAIVIHLNELPGIELDQRQVDAFGVWAAESHSIFDPIQPTVADLATTAFALFTTLTRYIDQFSRLIMCSKPVNAPKADDLLGKVTDDIKTLKAPPAASDELLYRQLTGWAQLPHGSIASIPLDLI